MIPTRSLTITCPHCAKDLTVKAQYQVEGYTAPKAQKTVVDKQNWAKAVIYSNYLTYRGAGITTESVGHKIASQVDYWIKQGMTDSDFQTTIDHLITVKRWSKQYLTPAIVFGKNFKKYRDEAVAHKGSQRRSMSEIMGELK